jgi:hypothetical protein
MYAKEGLKVHNANKAVGAGIYLMQTLITEGRLKIFSTCTGLIKEMRSYHTKADKNGKVSIVKKNDHHCFAKETLVQTPGGAIPIGELPPSGVVLTPTGFAAYEKCGLIEKDAVVVDVLFENETIRCTPDHLFMTANGWVQAQDLIGHEVVTCETPANVVDKPVASGITTTTCLAVKAVSGTSDVYCLTVPDQGAFVVGTSNLLVHNCDALRYALMTKGTLFTAREAEERDSPVVSEELYVPSMADDAWAI